MPNFNDDMVFLNVFDINHAGGETAAVESDQ